MPLECGRSKAGNAGGDPVSVGVAPHVPVVGALDVALRAKDPARGTVRLIAVKLQRLGSAGVREVEVHVISQVGSGIRGAKLLPPQGIRVGRSAADAELG